MNSQRFETNKNFLCLLAKSNLKLALINNADKEQIYSICECILNVCYGNIKLSPEDFNSLKPFKRTFNRILDRKNKLLVKKKIILQKGGFLQFLIPAVISGLASIISAVISKNNA